MLSAVLGVEDNASGPYRPTNLRAYEGHRMKYDLRVVKLRMPRSPAVAGVIDSPGANGPPFLRSHEVQRLETALLPSKLRFPVSPPSSVCKKVFRPPPSLSFQFLVAKEENARNGLRTSAPVTRTGRNW